MCGLLGKRSNTGRECKGLTFSLRRVYCLFKPERSGPTYLKTMNKLFLSIATSAICLTGMAPQAQAAPAWANEVASYGCRFISQGYSPNKAGEKAALAVMKGPNSGALITAHQNGTMQNTLLRALVRTCPETLMEASRRSSI